MSHRSRSDAMEPPQPLLQPPMVGIDVVEMKVRRERVWFAGSRQDMRRDPVAPRAGNDRAAAIAAERIGWRDDAPHRGGDRGAGQTWKHGIGCGAVAVSSDD